VIAERAVLITGTSSGIGEACALHLDRLGFRVFAGIRKPADGEALQAKASPRLTPLSLDVTDKAEADAAVTTVDRALGAAGLWGLVNNAGIARGGPLEFLPVQEFRRQLEVNVVGQLMVTQAFLPLIRRARGRIVNMSSVSGRLAGPFMGPYSSSKFALEALSDALRGELRPWGIGVSVIEPSNVATPIWEKSLETGMAIIDRLPPRAKELYGEVIARMPEVVRGSARSGVPAELVARAVAQALTARQPRTRYRVGRGAGLTVAFGRLAPDRFRDWVIARRLNA
jgi:NAD(P)-dependent dehydrogenase (short-subunit alcohol dehydrogenase family)